VTLVPLPVRHRHRPCPNADFGPEDVHPGQVWLHSFAQVLDRREHTVTAVRIPRVRLDNGETVDVGALLSTWEYRRG
jgi:hypothetical protein